MTAAVQQLSAIPFENLIGGPLVAAIDAQSAAAKASVLFINEVGLESVGTGTSAGKKAINVSFQYSKDDAAGTQQTFTLDVPILAIVPIPYIRIEYIDIDFTAKLTDATMTTTTVVTSTGGSANLGLKKFGLRGSFSRSRSTNSTSTTSSDYSMSVKVRAVQSEMPAGMARIIDILEGAIKDAPVPPPPTNSQSPTT